MNKSNKKKSPFRIALYLVIGVIIINIPLSLFGMSIGSIFNPIKRSEEGIRNYILSITPIGTNMYTVLSVIEDKDWRGGSIIEQGASFQTYSDFKPRQENAVIGEKHINAYLGSYRALMLFETFADAVWCFDENSKLIDVLVRKYVDSV